MADHAEQAQAQQQPVQEHLDQGDKQAGGTFMTRMLSTARTKAEAAKTSTAAALQAAGAAAAAAASAASQRMPRRHSETEGTVVSGDEKEHTPDAGSKGVAPPVAPAVTAGSNSATPTSAAAASASAMASSLISAATDLGKKTRDTGSAAYHAAVEGIKRLAAPRRRVASIVRQDVRSRPVPQILLVCSTVVVTKGLHSYGIFRTAPPSATVEVLAAQLEGGMALIVSDVDPLAAAAVIKHFLASLDEPLLLRKLVDLWVAAGTDLEAVPGLLAELPGPNLATLRVLIEACYRVAAQFNLTGMNALALASELVPALLWRTAERNGTATSGARSVAAAASAAVGSAVPAISASIQALRSRLARARGVGAEGADVQAATEAGLVSAAEEPGLKGAAAPLPTSVGVLPPALQGDVVNEDEVGEDVVEGGEEEGEAEAGVPGARVPLVGAEKEAVVRCVEYCILNFEEVFAV